MQQQGKVYKIGVTEQITDKLKKRELILEVEGNYKQYLSFEAINDKCALLDPLRIGQSVNIEFNLNGRMAKDGLKAYNALQIWKVS